MKDFEESRQRIGEIDAEIVRLIGARMQIAAALGKAKKERGVPLRDWEVEKRVLDRAVRQATESGVSAELVRATMHLLIEESRAQQERLHYCDYHGSAEDILIIGGAGKMGQWFAHFFQDQGHRVFIHDLVPNGSDFPCVSDLDAGLKKASLALIATPLENVPDTLGELTRRHYDGTVFDIASLKGHLKDALAEARGSGLHVTSIHPMFGAQARTLCDKVICVCDCGDPEATNRVESFFADTAVKLVRLTLDEHDKIVSYVLGLSHFISILFAAVLRESGLTYEQLDRVGSTTFASQMVTTATVIRENPDLYYVIQRYNPFSAQLFDTLQECLETIARSVHSGDRDAFVGVMKAGRRWLENAD